MNDASSLPESSSPRKRVMGAVFLLAMSALFGYFFMYLPVQHGLRDGHFVYSMKGVVLGPVTFYAAILVLLGIATKEKLRKLNSKGKETFTRQGWLIVASMVAVAAVTYWAWSNYIHSLGFVSPGN